MEFKLVINEKEKSYQKVVDTDMLTGKKIGDKFKGDSIGFAGYEFEITGGSDKEGFPMRKDLPGIRRRKLLLSGGVGFKPKAKGMKKRKSVHGNTISENIVQVNCKVIKKGKKKLADTLKKEPVEPAPEKKG